MFEFFTNNGSTFTYYNEAYQIGINTSTLDATAGVKLYVGGGINFTGSLYKSAYDLTTFITTTTANSSYQPKNAKNTYFYVYYANPKHTKI